MARYWHDIRSAATAAPGSYREAARGRGRFLKLHQVAPFETPSNPFRSVSISQLAPAFERRLAEGVGSDARSDVRSVGDLARGAAAFPGPLTWILGVLHPAYTVYRDRRLAGVIDFGDLCAGDATDLAGGVNTT